VRQSQHEDDRPTLFPCRNCGGTGKLIVETARGRYKQIDDRWCHGAGTMDHEMLRLYRRWLAIFKANRSAGKCGGAPTVPAPAIEVV
jgi:hypothetical protein